MLYNLRLSKGKRLKYQVRPLRVIIDLKVFIRLYHHCEYIMYLFWWMQFFMSLRVKNIFTNIKLFFQRLQ